MKRPALPALFAVSALAATSVGFGCASMGANRNQAGQELQESISAGQIESILIDEGYGSPEVVDGNKIRFKADGSNVLIIIHTDGDLQLYFGVTGIRLSPEDINEWNRSMRLSRAYIDKVGDVVLEADLLADAGVTANMVRSFIHVFTRVSVPKFIQFIREHDRGTVSGIPT